MPEEPYQAMAAVPVIVNMESGGGRDPSMVESLRAEFDKAGIVADIVPVARGAQIAQAVREAKKRRPRVIVAAGGDGTLNAVANELRGTDIALGVLPAGTANHFLRDMRIPLDMEDAIRTIAEGHRVAVDMGQVNGVSFINNSSLGLYPGIVRRRLRQQRLLGRSKRSAMIWAILAALRRAPLLDVWLSMDGREGRLRSPFVFIGNNEYTMEGFNVGRREHLDAGALSIYATARSTAIGLCALALRALFGRLRQAQDFVAMRAVTLRVESSYRQLLVATDGEVRPMQTPLEYCLLPRALQVIVPKAAP